MGNDISSWRAHIGRYNCTMRFYKSGNNKLEIVFQGWTTCLWLFVLTTLLSGDIELNPGPRPVTSKSEILEQVVPPPSKVTAPIKPFPSASSSPQNKTVSSLYRKNSVRYSPEPGSARKLINEARKLQTQKPQLAFQPTWSKVDELNRAVVPLEGLTFPDYCFSMTFDFSLRTNCEKYQSLMSNIGRTVSALLNGAGGIISVNSDNRPVMPKHVDQWLTSLRQYLAKFIPEDILLSCVKCKPNWNGNDVNIKVIKSRHVVTYHSNLQRRIESSCVEIRQYHAIVDLLQEKHKEEQVIQQFRKVHSITYEDEWPDLEGRRSEYKFYEAKTYEEMKQKLLTNKPQNSNLSNVEKAIFSFFNSMDGGEIILGLQELKTGIYLVKGQLLSAEDEKSMRKLIRELMVKSPDGEVRQWGFGSSKPEEGINWRLYFHLVNNCPENMRRVLVQICIQPFRDCVFSSVPECYTVNKAGRIEAVSLEKWKDMHSVLPTPAVNEHSTSNIVEKLPDLENDIQSLDTHILEYSVDKCVLRKLSYELQQHTRSQYGEFQEESKCISWRKDSVYWDIHKESANTEIAHQFNDRISQNRILKPQNPMQLFPDRDIIFSCFDGKHDVVNVVLDSIQVYFKDTNVAVLACSDIKTMISDMKGLKSNPGHIADFLIITGDSGLTIWTAVSHYHAEHISYIRGAIRTMKALVLCELNTHPDVRLADWSSFHVQGIIQSTSDGKVYRHGQKSKDSSTDFPPYLQKVISQLLVKNKHYFRNSFDEEFLIALTEEQMHKLWPMNSVDVLVIRGPPGSGKTIMALSICERCIREANFRQFEIMYICPSVPLGEFVKLQKNCNVQVAATCRRVLELVRNGIKSGIRQIIIDDIQYIKWKQKDLMELYELIYDRHDVQLTIFMDSTYQNFMSTDGNTEHLISTAAEEYRKTKPHFRFLCQPPLYEILRNSLIVSSYFIANVASTDDQKRLCSQTRVLGHDVTVQSVENMFTETEGNSIICLVNELLRIRSWTYKHMYSPKDIFIAVDSNGQGSGSTDVQRLEKIFKKKFEGPTQKANSFPITGLVIDELKNFIGLEAKVVIVVLANKSKDVLRHLNHHLKLFAVSRGIMRVAFLLNKQPVQSVLDNMQFSNEKYSMKKTHELLAQMHKLTFEPDDTIVHKFMNLSVPQSDNWDFQKKRIDWKRTIRKLIRYKPQEVTKWLSGLSGAVPADIVILEKFWEEEVKAALKNNFESSKTDLEKWLLESVPKKFEQTIRDYFWELAKPVLLDFINHQKQASLDQWIHTRVPNGWLEARNIISIYVDIIYDNILKSKDHSKMNCLMNVFKLHTMQSSHIDNQLKLLEEFVPKIKRDQLNQVLVFTLFETLLKDEIIGYLALDIYSHGCPYDLQQITRELWERFCKTHDVTQLCRRKIQEKFSLDDLPNWMEMNIPYNLRTDPAFIQSIVSTILQCSLINVGDTLSDDTYLVEEETMKQLLCLLGGHLNVIQNNTLIAALNIIIQYKKVQLVEPIFRIIWKYGFVRRDLFMGVDSQLHGLDAFKKLQPNQQAEVAAEVLKFGKECSQKNTIVEEFTKYIEEGDVTQCEKTMEWIKDDHPWYWHDLPHYQCIALTCFCKVVMSRSQHGGMANTIINKCVDKYFSLITNKVHLLYSMQLVVHRLKNPPDLLFALWRIMLTRSGEHGIRIISKAAFLEWKNATYPLHEEGRMTALREFSHFERGPYWNQVLD